MTEIVKIGYKELTFNTLYFALLDNYNIVSTLSKEKVKEKVKEALVFYYSKSSLFQEYMNPHDVIYYKEYEENKQYKIVEIPQKELELILLKNKLGGYITSNIMQEKEFDRIFEELYTDGMRKMIKNTVKRLGLLEDKMVKVHKKYTFKKFGIKFGIRFSRKL